MAYGPVAGGPDVTRASKDEGRQPRFVGESVKNAVELYVGIFVLAGKVREVGKHTNLFVDVESGQHIPAVRTRPITGATLCELGEVTASSQLSLEQCFFWALTHKYGLYLRTACELA
jgi:hypothetical protein